jgi:hypothetical protein
MLALDPNRLQIVLPVAKLPMQLDLHEQVILTVENTRQQLPFASFDVFNIRMQRLQVLLPDDQKACPGWRFPSSITVPIGMVENRVVVVMMVRFLSRE